MSFSQAVSGLNAAATNLDVIGNNIANSATYGFKSGTASFADMFAGSKVGLGVNESVIQGIKDSASFAPLHNPAHLIGIAEALKSFPQLKDKNVAV
ncbi:flagellar basal body protein, partial [Salmonella enterica subsp. enterica serovar Kentucky]|nr:flagellar basal body protein [Salmonella enterica subsp. enterica serovar Kentucky]